MEKMNNPASNFSIVTPSFNQLDWLRLCVASVRDQTAAAGGGMHNAKSGVGNDKSGSQIPDLVVEHIIQDAGTPGIEDFAREIGAAFYRDGQLVFSGKNGNSERRPSPARPTGTGEPKGGISSQIRSVELLEETSQSKSPIPNLEASPSAHSASPIPNSKFQIPNYAISVYSERDEGMYDAINRGLIRASGNICAWLNCDEQYLPGSLFKIGRFFSDNADAEMVVGDTILLDSLLEPRSFRPGVPPIRDYIQIFNLNLHSSSLFFRRKLLDRGIWLGDRFRSIGDSEWIAKLMDSGVRIRSIHRDISTFVLGKENLSQNELSAGEKTQWRNERSISFSGRILLRSRHLVRRVAAGAYWPRRRGVAVFTPSDPASRKTVPARWLDFRFRV